MDKIGLGSCLLIILGIGLIIVPAIPQTIINISLILTGLKLDLLTVVSLLQNMWLINLVPKIVGVVILSVITARSRLKVDSSKIKRQIIKVAVLAFVVLMLVGAIFLEVPVAKAESVATTSFILGFPLPIADYYIGKSSTDSYFAINGSNWVNLMFDVGTKTWTSYSSNYTKVEQLVLGQVSSGTVYLKEVPFNLTLMSSIPANVSVICSIDGVICTYINPVSSLGSPYTVSIGSGNNVGDYVVTDSGNRILLASPNASFAIQSAVNSVFGYGTVNVLCNITVTAPIAILQSINYVQQGVANLQSDYLIIGDSTHLVQGYTITINDIEGDGVHNGITFVNAIYGQIKYNFINNCNYGFFFNAQPTSFSYPFGAAENTIIGGMLGAWNGNSTTNIGNTAIKYNNGDGWMEGNRFLQNGIQGYKVGIDFGNGTKQGYTWFQGFFGLEGDLNPIDIIWGTATHETIETYYTVPGITGIPKDCIVLTPTNSNQFTGPTYMNDTGIQVTPNNVNQAIPIGLNSGWGTSQIFYFKSLSNPDLADCAIPAQIGITRDGTFTGENVTVRISMVHSDGTASDLDKIYTTTGTEWLSGSDWASLIQDMKPIQYIVVTAITASNSTSVTLNVTVIAFAI